MHLYSALHTSLQHILEYTSEPKPSHLMYNENDFSAVPEERGLRQRTADDGFGPVGGFDSDFGGGVTCSE